VYIARVRTTIALIMLATAACGSKHDAPPPTTTESAAGPSHIDPGGLGGSQKAPGAEAYAKMTRDSIPGDQLTGYVPDKLGGVAISDRMPQEWGAAAAYKLSDGGYANLDIKNTFMRATGDDTLIKLNLEDPKLCPTKKSVAGRMACVRVDPDRTTIFWYLPDRITVTLSGPTEALTRSMAADLRLADLAQLSAQHAPGQAK
jgi:hypothetical protein